MTESESIKFERIARELLKIQGRDFDTEFEKWQDKRNKISPNLKSVYSKITNI
jgi:hypothetical protein